MDARLLTAFNFHVELYVDGSNKAICDMAFAECDGLEFAMAPRTIREGGNNRQQIHLMGPVSYGQVTLRRGMSKNADLWQWFQEMVQEGKSSTRAMGNITLLGADLKPQVVFQLTGCLPVKLKGPTLNAKDGQVAIEEIQLVYEQLKMKMLAG